MLEEQIMMEKKRKEAAKGERFGEVDDKFFQNFGCSAR